MSDPCEHNWSMQFSASPDLSACYRIRWCSVCHGAQTLDPQWQPVGDIMPFGSELTARFEGLRATTRHDTRAQ